jgi:hypothetical protein
VRDRPSGAAEPVEVARLDQAELPHLLDERTGVHLSSRRLAAGLDPKAHSDHALAHGETHRRLDQLATRI